MTKKKKSHGFGFSVSVTLLLMHHQTTPYKHKDTTKAASGQLLPQEHHGTATEVTVPGMVVHPLHPLSTFCERWAII